MKMYRQWLRMNFEVILKKGRIGFENEFETNKKINFENKLSVS